MLNKDEILRRTALRRPQSVVQYLFRPSQWLLPDEGFRQRRGLTSRTNRRKKRRPLTANGSMTIRIYACCSTSTNGRCNVTALWDGLLTKLPADGSRKLAGVMPFSFNVSESACIASGGV
jgi:hypothetical protein